MQRQVASRQTRSFEAGERKAKPERDAPLLRATTKSYSQIVAELIRFLLDKDCSTIGDEIESFFANQKSDSRYWPDDDEVREELQVLPAYRRLGRGRLRMVIESIEDHLRGWIGTKTGLGGERVMRGKLVIEHVMPRKWTMTI